MEGQQLSGNKENFKKIREVKKKIFAWEKLKKHLCGTFYIFTLQLCQTFIPIIIKFEAR